MVRWLRAALVLLAGLCAGAWRPPPQPLLLTTLHRTRREAPDNTRHLQLLGWHLELQENTAIRAPYYNECQFYTGRVLYEEKSSATVTECGDQLYGLLHVDGEEFVLQPTAGKENSDGAHVLRRRDVLLSEQPAAYNLTGDTVSDLELDLSNEESATPMPQVRLRHNHDRDVQEYRNVIVSRPVTGPQELWLEMAIVADHTMMKFHGQDETRVRHYILALMNIVSAIFNDPSVSSNMTLVINQLYLENDPVVKYGNVKKTLEAVNKWNYRHLMKLPPDRAGWDAAAWLTRAPLGGPSGFAPVSGVCSRERSAAIIRDEGLTSAFVIAHELAHLLGLTHDGENQCAAAAQRGSVMAPTVLASLHNFSWSACSKKQLHDKAKKWWCLHTRSQDDGVELGGARELPKYAFTMDEQCRTEFGDGFSVCKSVKVRSACRRLWCAHRAQPDVCRSKRGAPLDGTPCGPGQWCVNRVCEPMPGHGIRSEDRVEEPPERPHWEEWGVWSTCNADCGYGLRTRSRRCWYKGEVTESACEGGASQVATCWAGSACAAARDARSDWCRRRRSSLIPHIHTDESQQCEMWCVDYTGGEPSSFGSLPDATPCSYDRPYDLCYQGACVKGQCNPSDSTCNWCPDGYCSNNTHLYHRQLGKGWTRITMVPHEANQLSVHIATPVPLSIAIRERKRDKHILELRKHSKRVELEQQHNYLKYDPNVPQNLQIIDLDSNVIDIKEERFGWEGQVVAASSLLRWTQTDADVHISAQSPLQTDLMIMAIPEHELGTEEPVSVEVSVNYSSPAGNSRSRPMEYSKWPVRGPCSASCGGGLRVVRPRCLRGQQCAAPRYEACNTHRCEFQWRADEWESCSATCGDSGLQERQLFCVPVTLNSTYQRDLIRAMVSPALCSEPRPEQQQPCNRLPCPVYWQEMPWTPCSTTCGRGVSRRPLVCPAQHEFLCGARPRERRRRCRLRRCPAPRPAPCAADALKYCELFPTDQLRRNCILPQFRKYCCNACAAADRTVRDVG
ncbi:A disintegrin and metalloproteinase with thrombospondin motifs 1-like [Cydia amplana]|uniref:A disintegrin and metalloproteinase with thrombospondin motifs 1-like n=1 Tax=Cydia amplana TaxID=1869771 RepID=UPI002FE57335